MNTLDLGLMAHRPREHRESYTDQVVNQALAAANRTTASAATATCETIARLWESAFASGESSVLAPWQLAHIGRQIVLRGESVWWRSLASGLLPVSDHDVSGKSAAPGRWQYRVTMPTPSSSITRKASASDVLHVRIGAPLSQPWRGCSPLASSEATASVLREVERSLSEEHSGPVGSLIGVPDPEGSSAIANVIAALKGRAILTEAGELVLAGESSSARTVWRPNRVGPQPAASTPSVREGVERSLLSAGGVPAALVYGGTDHRDAWRAFLAGTIAPTAKLVSSELARMGLDSKINFSAIMSSDLQARARAYGALTKGGMSDADARRICGFE